MKPTFTTYLFIAICLIHSLVLHSQQDQELGIHITRTVNPITFTLEPTTFTANPASSLAIVFKDREPVDTYTLNYLNNLGAQIQVSPIAPGNYSISSADLTQLSNNNRNLVLTVTVTSGTNTVLFSPTISIAAPSQQTVNSGRPVTKSRSEIIRELRARRNFSNPYDHKRDLVHLYFDTNGKLLNSLPVNVDQNDRFIFYIVTQVGYEEMYSVNILEGEYAPVDLQIRPHTVPMDIQAAAQAAGIQPEVTYTLTTIKVGPFTTEDFEFQIAFDDTSNKIITHSEPYSVKINKLFHVGVGVSLINTNLSNPNFRTFANPTDTVIKAFNNGSRTLVTFNAIWYWSVLQQNPSGSITTNGRDVLKDEPTFSLRRIFPTIGITIDNTFRDNIFGGFVYEFARGGSLIAGMHYGKVRVLANRAFTLGETPFHGSDSDIKIDEIYRPGFFFGINLDTRIFNALFSRGR